MAYMEILASLIIALNLCSYSFTTYDFSNTYFKEYTRNITLKQGFLKGIVMASRTNRVVSSVEQYKGIPYAAPPVGDLRFMPSGSAPSWFGTKFADTFSAVCPQKFPDTQFMSAARKKEFLRLQQFLHNQSEDCLYLNIYAPYQGNIESSMKYPVMVYIHGESFEWNSGNPYDGSVLAAYGQVIVVTLNFRLGILGFLKAGTEEYSKSNFGLIDQIAALLWVKDNIAVFGGDPYSVTLFGHGTGAVCASLLMLSPMVLQEGNEMLFQRAILMGGSSLSDWALAGNSRDVTYQVGKALNCQIHDNFAACLRRKRLDEIMAAGAVTPPYKTQFGPVVDSLVVPNDPKKLMTTYNDIFKRFEMMYGVTELESIHLLSPDAIKMGMLEQDRDHELRKYLGSRCEMKPDVCVTRTLAEYTDAGSVMDDDRYSGNTGHGIDRASVARDSLLDILSDARSVAPVVQMARYHASLNLQSYFYVFSHRTQSKEYIINKSCAGDELPYVFGVPMGSSKFSITDDNYTEKERLFSELIMAYFCNFAYNGNPNVPRKNKHYRLNHNDWIDFETEWPEFDINQQQYLQLEITPHVSHHYRDNKIKFWIDIFPEVTINHTYTYASKKTVNINSVVPLKSKPPWVLKPPVRKITLTDKFENFNKPLANEEVYGKVRLIGNSPPDNMINKVVYETVINPSDSDTTGLSTTITVVIGSIFLITNMIFFFIFFIRRLNKKKLSPNIEILEQPGISVKLGSEDPHLPSDCNILNMTHKPLQDQDTYKSVKTSGNGITLKLSKELSSRPIDAHTKVRDWITNEIVYKYSPKFLRRPRDQLEITVSDHQQNNNKPNPLNDFFLTLGQIPTGLVTHSKVNYFRTPFIKSTSTSSSKAEKISVAIDATPLGREVSPIQQQLFGLTKPLKRPLRRSLTLEDFSMIRYNQEKLRKSATSINLKYNSSSGYPKVEHTNSKSDPMKDFYADTGSKMKTFEPFLNVNVTCRESAVSHPLTPEESLLTMKRRNFPKVLPDYPTPEVLANQRRSMPAACTLFLPVPKNAFRPNAKIDTVLKSPPVPPLRTTSTLTREANNTQSLCQSAPMLAHANPALAEPEVSYNNLYFGPLLPKLAKNVFSSSENYKLNTKSVYDKLRICGKIINGKNVAKTVITANHRKPIRKLNSKVIIKPTITRSISDSKKNNNRVLAHDNLPAAIPAVNECKHKNNIIKVVNPSQIHFAAKKAGSKRTSSSDFTSTPSEESDTAPL